jgi:hypothetical protein
LVALACVACSHHPNAPATLANAAALTKSLDTPQVIFVTGSNVSDDTAGRYYREVSFTIDPPLTDLHVSVFDIEPGTIMIAPAEVVEDSRGNRDCGVSSLCDPSSEAVLYSARLPAAPSAGSNSMAVIVPLRPDARAARVSPRDADQLEALKSPSFAAITSIEPLGIDLDGDHHPDLAFLHVCVEYPAGDSICGDNTIYAARRTKDSWRLTHYCADSSGPGCGARDGAAAP